MSRGSVQGHGSPRSSGPAGGQLYQFPEHPAAMQKYMRSKDKRRADMLREVQTSAANDAAFVRRVMFLTGKWELLDKAMAEASELLQKDTLSHYEEWCFAQAAATWEKNAVYEYGFPDSAAHALEGPRAVCGTETHDTHTPGSQLVALHCRTRCVIKLHTGAHVEHCWSFSDACLGGLKGGLVHAIFFQMIPTS